MDSERELRSQFVRALDEVLPAAPWLEAAVADDLRRRRRGEPIDRGADRPQRRRLWLGRPAAQWATVAALLIVAIVAGAIATGVLRSSGPVPARIPNPSPLPTLPASGEVVPGSYRLVDSDTTDVRSDWLTLTVPAGWSANGSYLINKNGSEPPHGMAISPWEIRQVYEDPCYSTTTPATTIGPTVDDLVAALKAQNRGATATAVDVSIDGYRGKRIDLMVPLDVNPGRCEGGLYLSWLDSVGGQRYNQAPGQHDELYILDVNGHRLVINTVFYAVSDKAEIAAILASARITP